MEELVVMLKPILWVAVVFIIVIITSVTALAIAVICKIIKEIRNGERWKDKW